MGLSERQKELKRRRQRRKKYDFYKRRLDKATVSEKEHIAGQLRKMTPGADELIERWELIERA